MLARYEPINVNPATPSPVYDRAPSDHKGTVTTAIPSTSFWHHSDITNGRVSFGRGFWEWNLMAKAFPQDSHWTSAL